MDHFVIVLVVGPLIAIVAVTEVLAAILPLLVVVLLVPPEQRAQLAELVAAADSSRRLRLWPALRLAATARRERACRTRPGSKL
jgi:hypothetical protein